MTPLHGFYAYNALLGYQNGTATRFLLKPQYLKLSKTHVKLVAKCPTLCKVIWYQEA